MLTEAVEGALKAIFYQRRTQGQTRIYLSPKDLTTLKAAIHRRISQVDPVPKDVLVEAILKELLKDLEEGKLITIGEAVVYMKDGILIQLQATPSSSSTTTPQN